MEGERKKKERKREGERGRNSFPTRQQKYHTSFSIDIISKDPPLHLCSWVDRWKNICTSK